MTLEPWKSDSILIRFEHILENNEDEQYSKAVTFNFHDVFRSFNVISIRETTLSANQWLDEAKRFHFKAKTEDENSISFISESPEKEKRQLKLDINPDISPRQYFKRANKYKRQHAIEDDDDDLTITLKPMEIRTFIIELE